MHRSACRMTLADPPASPEAVAGASFVAFGRRDAGGMAARRPADGYARSVGRAGLEDPAQGTWSPSTGPARRSASSRSGVRRVDAT